MVLKYIMSLFTAILLAGVITHTATADLGEGHWVHHEKQGPAERIYAVFPGLDSEPYTLWAATYNSLHAYDGKYWKKFTGNQQGMVEHVPFFRDSSGRFYFERNGTLFIFDNGIITAVNDTELKAPIVGADNGDGTVYFGSYNINRSGLYRFDGENIEKLDTMRIKSLAFDNDGKLWATGLDPDTGSTVLVMRDNGTWQDHTAEIADILPVNKGDMTVQPAPDGTLWLSSRDGHGICHDGIWETWTEENPNGVGPLFLEFDTSGTVWGYDYGNLYRLDPDNRWSIMFEPQVGPVNRADFLADDGQGHIITIDDNLLYYLEADDWLELPNPYDMASDVVSCVMYDKNGKLFCGHEVSNRETTNPEDRGNMGVSVYDGDHWENYTQQNGIHLNNLYLMRMIFDDEIVAYTDFGLKTFDGDNWYAFADTLKGEDDFIRDIFEDPAGPLWISTNTGLLEYYDSPDVPSYKTHVFPQGISQKKQFYQINIDPDGNLYMLADYGVLVTYDKEEEWITHQGSSLYTKDIAIEDDGLLWAARATSISYWDPVREWQDVVQVEEGWLAEIDDEGRVWGSGYGATGYYEDGEWNTIDILTPHASSSLAVSGDGRYALNSFDIDLSGDAGHRERTAFYGIWEFVPGSVSVENKPEPLTVLEATAYPNPFNPSTTIQFTLPEAAKTTLSIYNISGQKVATIAHNYYSAGVHTARWNALTDNGDRCSSGIYLYRIQTPYANKSGKIVLMR